jgi:hypothetical protein
VTGLGHRLRNPHSRHLVPTNSGSSTFEGGTVLDGYNDKLDGKFLHPTKGFRYPATKSGIAGIVMGYIKQGLVHPIDVPRIRQEFTNLGHKMPRKDLVYLNQETETVNGG